MSPCCIMPYHLTNDYVNLCSALFRAPKAKSSQTVCDQAIRQLGYGMEYGVSFTIFSLWQTERERDRDGGRLLCSMGGPCAGKAHGLEWHTQQNTHSKK